MAVSSVDAKDTPEAQLRSLIEKFDPEESAGGMLGPEGAGLPVTASRRAL